jgi:hypothetical protein
VVFEILRLKDSKAQMALWQEVRGGGTVRSARDRVKAVVFCRQAAVHDPFERVLTAGRRFLRQLQEVRLYQSDSDAQQGELLLPCELEHQLRRLKAASRSAHPDHDA